MARPNVNIKIADGALGQLASATDGTSLLVIGVPGTYISARLSGKKTHKFLALSDAEAAGFTAQNDLAEQALAWEHIKDFYANAPAGTVLYVLVVLAAALPAFFTDATVQNDELKAALKAENGAIKMVAAVSNPAIDDFDDTLDAIPLAQALSVEEFGYFRPVIFLLEGRDFDASAALAEDLRLQNAPNVAVMVGQSQARMSALATAGIAKAAKAAQAGYLLGRLAAVPVQRNAGRVIDGAMRGIEIAGLSDGRLVSALSETEQDAFYLKGYNFFVSHAGRSGWYFVSGNTCAAATSDYTEIERVRVIQKAARIARRNYLDFLLDEIAIAADGKLSPIVIKNLEQSAKSAIEQEMRGEIVAVEVFVNPEQDVLATGKIQELVQITPFGLAKTLEATLQYLNPNLS